MTGSARGPDHAFAEAQIARELQRKEKGLDPSSNVTKPSAHDFRRGASNWKGGQRLLFGKCDGQRLCASDFRQEPEGRAKRLPGKGGQKLGLCCVGYLPGPSHKTVKTATLQLRKNRVTIPFSKEHAVWNEGFKNV